MAGKLISLFISITGKVGISLLNKINSFKGRRQTGWTLYASVEEVYEGEEKEYPFEWIEEIAEGDFDSLFEDEDDEEDFYNRMRNQSVRLIKSEKSLNEISVICFFYAAPEVILEDHQSVLVFQDMNPWLQEVIMKELVPHYKVVKEFFVQGKFKEIQLSELKKESKELVKSLLSKGYYPVVSDLYRGTQSEQSTGPRNLKYFLIKKESVNPLELKENKRIQQFLLNESFQKNRPFFLKPVGWKLQEDLRDSITIRSFYNFAEKIVLLVNTVDDSIIGIYIFGAKADS
ncbi:hypothetical protein SAMN05444673_4032 [Bacillus sp. OV166]|uniref:hypothetical protein n=1 Tax=Bacillus sp. OV166 TaxID=1882763 RepID=UPI000A2AA87F|nr:hypothetical protein [Bacillus sp. OV166]SMQ80906.1 hypothetical protein SAMN05444673_4032 [Bacillus sp. OV166]